MERATRNRPAGETARIRDPSTLVQLTPTVLRIACRPRLNLVRSTVENKGIIERAHDHLERSFLPGRTFTCPDDFNPQPQDWFTWRNARRVGSLGCAPTERIGADKAAMLPLPPVAPATGWRASTRLARDHYVRIDSNDYSVDPAWSAAGSRSSLTCTVSGGPDGRRRRS